MGGKFTLLLLIIFLFINLSALSVLALTEEEISARGAVLMDRSSRRVLFNKNHEERLPMASTTKIMTGLLALEEGDLRGRVVVSERAAGVEGSSIWLEKGEVKTLEELVFGLMLRSGNDAATVIAEYLAGSVEDFSVMMTDKAREKGALNTSFRNPHGLHDEEHFTTAYDLGLITCAALDLPEFREIIKTREKRITWPGHQWDRFLRNQNKLLDMYEGADGVKTGWTTPAGRCFVGSATRDSWQLVAVVLNAPAMWEDATTLLDYGFDNWKLHSLIRENQFVKTGEVKGGAREKVRLIAAGEFTYPLQEGEEEHLVYSIAVEQPLKAPLRKGDKMGEVTVFLNEEELGGVDLLAGESVDRKNIFLSLKNRWKSWFLYLF
ncbi:MAG: D-alanyl-D-alanine carboxypeptidase [Candidatus Syntrophonatronum acetioxidans]|uniref:serine-type D-Ala-D-Ala carboxypeptidase n=1 Tax=Candidatus Syntrophonatronum acetioxidans TaxID=1795816 RepID=A0A424YFL1_9FIRM|nr:MAG: D-alanyl-D-alanine carboxypeptidase [Candidatus Syntrophonatronum acetioxidans]